MVMITISRQIGSLADEIAEALAKRLGYRLVQCELINRAARLAGTPEVALATIDELGLFGLNPPGSQRRAYKRALKKIIADLVDEGDIILVCRAGQVLLQDYPEAFHVHITASPSVRAKRIAESQGISLKCAQAQVEASDQSRQKDLLRNYNIRWEDPTLYHLVINTETSEINRAVEMICQEMNKAFERRKSPSTEEMNLDKIT